MRSPLSTDNFLLMLLMASFALFLLACSPTHALKTCDDPGTDCCTTDEQCLQYFGIDFPFCAEGGSCAECITSEHCGEEAECLNDSVLGPYCALTSEDTGS